MRPAKPSRFAKRYRSIIVHNRFSARMTVTIHQPNYLPWIGYFHKMAKVDQFVFLDNVPFSKNSYQNRARIKTAQGPAWLTVPVKTSGNFGQLTHLIEADPAARWGVKHLRTIQQNYSKAPHYKLLAETIFPVLEAEWKYLADAAVSLIERIAHVLGIRIPMVRASSLGVDGASSELLLDICSKLDASEYLSGPSGRNYLDESIFGTRNIRLAYHSFP